MEERELYIEALLPLALPRTLTYLVPEECGEVEVGQRVLVPLGRHKFYSAVVRRVGVPKPEGYAVKAVLQVLDGPAVVGQRQLDFWEWMASYYLSTEGEVMDAALPSGFKLESETKLAIHPEYTGEVSDLSDKEIRLVSLLSEEGSLSLQEIEKRFSVARDMGWVQCLLERKIIVRGGGGEIPSAHGDLPFACRALCFGGKHLGGGFCGFGKEQPFAKAGGHPACFFRPAAQKRTAPACEASAATVGKSE